MSAITIIKNNFDFCFIKLNYLFSKNIVFHNVKNSTEILHHVFVLLDRTKNKVLN